MMSFVDSVLNLDNIHDSHCPIATVSKQVYTRIVRPGLRRYVLLSSSPQDSALVELHQEKITVHHSLRFVYHQIA